MKVLKESNKISEVTYEIVFHKYYAALVVYADQFVNDSNCAEDMVQDVFLKLLDKARNNESLSNVRAYLYTSVKNRCVNYLQHKKVEDKYQSEFIHDIESDDNYLESIIKIEVYRKVNDALKKLPPQMQRIYLLVLQGHTSVEIAEDLELSVETVKTQRKRAKAILKRELGVTNFAIIALLLHIF